MLGREVVSHSEQQEALLSLVRTGRLPHSIIFSGPSGVGKKLIALGLAEALFCQSSNQLEGLAGCGECKACQLLKSDAHPDRHIVECSEKEQSSVTAIRELLGTIQLKPFAGGARVIIFNDAESLSVSALNILLKTLEEPLPSTYFVLITSNLAKLPATVLSRCQKWFFGPLSGDEMRAILDERYRVSGPRADLLMELSGGTLSNLDNLMEHVDRYPYLENKFSEIVKGDLKSGVQLAGEIHKEKESQQTVINILLAIARQKMITAPSPEVAYSLSRFISNLVVAAHYIKERNINSFYILQVAFEGLARGVKDDSQSPDLYHIMT